MYAKYSNCTSDKCSKEANLIMLTRGLLKEHATMLAWIAKMLDVILFLCAGFIAFYIQFHNLSFINLYWIALLLAAVLIVPVFSFFGVYRSIRGRSIWAHLKDLYLALITLMLLLAAITFLTKTGPIFSRAWFAMWGGFAVVFLTSFRISLRYILHAMRKRGWNQRRVLIIGTPNMNEDLTARISNNIYSGFNVVEVLDSKKIPKDFSNYVADLSVDEVWLGLPLKEEDRVKAIMYALRHNIITVRYFPDMFGIGLLNHAATTEILGLSAINVISSPMTGFNRLTKAIEDKVLSFLILLMISPLLLVIAVLVKLSSAGPVFYKQERMGWNGEKFNMLKFRSMPIGAEADTGAVWAHKEDNRPTRVGAFLRKTSLDELPQFINVLKGGMSIVGPRPERPVFVDKFKHEVSNYMQKHLVKAGITGWAQINGWRGNTSIEKRIEYDLYYIENWSLWFDLKIIALTLVKGFSHKNAY